jgi:hypothetical protein
MKLLFPVLVVIFIAVVLTGALIYTGYTTLGFLTAGIVCCILVAITILQRHESTSEEKILQTGLIQQYLLSNFTIDQSTLNYIKKILSEDFKLSVTTDQLISAIEKEQTTRELEIEEEEFTDFKNKFFITQNPPENLHDYIKQFVTVFGRGSVRNIYYLKRVLDEASLPFSKNDAFTDKIVELKNLIEKEIQRRGGSSKKEDRVVVKVCPTCGNEYPSVLLFCPFCERETHSASEHRQDIVYCPRCTRPMIRSILKKNGKFVKGYQCRNLKCLYEITDEESDNTQ